MLTKKFQDLKLSRLGMGNMRLPTKDGKIDFEKAQEIIDYAMRSGINYYDTAYVYHSGTSEAFLGKALEKYPRESYYLATKFHAQANPNIEEVFESQLRNLDTDYIDFYLFHCLTADTAKLYKDPNRHYLEYLLEQKRRGRIRHLGFSSHADLKTLEDFLNWYDGFEFVQIELNYLDWTLQDAKGQYEIITRHHLPVWVMEPVRGGRLATLGEEYDSLLKEKRPEWSIPTWAFKWLMDLDNVTMILSGMSTMEQIKDNVHTFEKEEHLTNDERLLLSNIAARLQSDIAVPCTACRYCCDGCPKHIDIPRWMALYNTLHLKEDNKKAEEALLQENGPQACIQCRQCTRHCPQHIDVPLVLSKIVKKDF